MPDKHAATLHFAKTSRPSLEITFLEEPLAMSQSFRIVPAGDSVVIVEFEARIDAGVNAAPCSPCGPEETRSVPGVTTRLPGAITVMVNVRVV